MTEIFSVDGGNGWFKGKTRLGELLCPSMIVKEKDFGRYEKFDHGYDVAKFHSGEHKGYNYYFGRDIKKIVSNDFRRLISTNADHGRYDMKEYRSMLLFGIAEMAAQFNKKTLDISLVATMPSSEINTNDYEILHKLLKGSHVIDRNDKEIIITIERVLIIEQPLGTLMNVILDESLRFIKSPQRTYSIVDFGSGTTIIDTFSNGRRDEKKSKTLNFGQIKLYDDIHDKLLESKQAMARETEIPHIDDALRNNHIVRLSDREKYNIEEETTEAIEEFINDVRYEFKRVLSKRKSIDEFIITGGGANNVGEEFEKQINDVEMTIVDESQMSNVRGGYKYMKSILKEEKQREKAAERDI